MNSAMFQRRVVEALSPHAAALVSVLRQLVRHPYPRTLRFSSSHGGSPSPGTKGRREHFLTKSQPPQPWVSCLFSASWERPW